MPQLPKVSFGKFVKDYSDGNIVERIARIESMEELEAIKPELERMSAAGSFSRRTAKRIERVANARYFELKTRLIQAPPSGRLLVPTHLTQGSLIVGPDGK